MTLQTQIFHPKLIIAGHFDEKISQFDNKTEFLLLNQSLQTELPGKIKDLRGKQIAEIKELKELNLNLFYTPQYLHVIRQRDIIKRLKEFILRIYS